MQSSKNNIWLHLWLKIDVGERVSSKSCFHRTQATHHFSFSEDLGSLLNKDYDVCNQYLVATLRKN
jgi:hypothetical protein